MKDTIITNVYQNTNIISYCKVINPDEYEELKSELVMQLYKMDEKVLINYHNLNAIEYLCFTIIKRINLGKIDSGIFYKRNSMTFTDTFPELPDIEFDKEEKLSQIKEIVESLHFYDRILFQMYYYDNLKLKDIAEKTGINLKSVSYSINKTRKLIKRKLC